MSFTSFNLSPVILSIIADQGYTVPTSIQTQAIPAILTGNDLMAAAQTGTGKTAAFTLPLLERLSKDSHLRANQARSLILVPTRELAVQIAASIEKYTKTLNLRSIAVFGGVKINPQMISLRKGADILIGTPGRILDLHRQNAIRFSQLEVLVIDEADRMLNLGFIDDLKTIIDLLPKQRQNLLFSATFSDEIRTLAKQIVINPIEVSIDPQNTTAITIDQWLCPVDTNRKSALLAHLIKANNWQQVLVFCKTKQEVDSLLRYLVKKNIKASAIHGDKSQNARTGALNDFKQGIIRVLIATDLASRGLDISGLPQVVNYNLPHIIEDYIHRIGRTGRAGLSGEAISLVSADEFTKLGEIERLIKQLIIRKTIRNFEPVTKLPESILDTRPIKPKKPKKQKNKIPDI